MIPARLRANSALWAAPVALGLVAFYYVVYGVPPTSDHHGSAPVVLSWVLRPQFAVCYACVSTLAVWESGRLRRDGVWQHAAVRSRGRVAADALLPVALLGWAMLVLPAALGFIQAGVWPDLQSLPMLLMGLVVASAHTVIGFAVGRVAPRLIAAPALLVVVFFAVAASASYSTFWPRHLSGQFTDLMFGELPPLTTLLPHVLVTGSIAVGAALLLLRPRRLAVGLAVAAVVAGALPSYLQVRDWGPNPVLSTGNAPTTCVGSRPQVCMPQATSSELTTDRKQIAAVFDRLAAAGVEVDIPTKISDPEANGRFGTIEPPAGTWYVPLTNLNEAEDLRYAVTRQAVAPPCEEAELTSSQPILLWAAAATDSEQAAMARAQDEAFTEKQEARLERSRRQLKEVRQRSASAQADWYRDTRQAACHSAKGEGR
ncbi:hypothetical protein ABZ820_40560 [Streptomyces diacarni]|uniref:DUF7224 domain-containing protein n=1 Tax=Streptomyces diacarni TaxID=2800381 RepID=UPI0033C70E6F